MHFWVSAARVGRPGTAPGHLSTSGSSLAKKMGTNWFMPAFVNRRLGESGRRLEEETMVCSFDLKKSRNDCRICELVIRQNQTTNTRGREDRTTIAYRPLGVSATSLIIKSRSDEQCSHK